MYNLQLHLLTGYANAIVYMTAIKIFCPDVQDDF